MSISGLVVVLSEDPDAANAAVAALAADSRLTLGERFDRRLALVADTPGVEADRNMWDDLRGLRGVDHVDVTFVSLDAPAAETPPGQETVHADR